MSEKGFISGLRSKLNRGNSWLTYDLNRLFTADKLEEGAADELEERLLLADAGIEATGLLCEDLRGDIRGSRVRNEQELRDALRRGLLKILAPCAQPLQIDRQKQPFILFVAGVNGVGKTTTIGKLASFYKAQGLKVMLAAGDTFRAAAVEQLTTWAQRADVPIIAQGAGADPASVIFDAAQAARARGMDLLIADTAGRLHTQSHLMDELRKVKRVLQKFDAGAPHETLLVVDATNGSNALNQAEQFNEAIGISGLVVTKLDGTAKGGVLLAIARKMQLPVRFVGVGEGVGDLLPFSAEQYVDAIVG